MFTSRLMILMGATWPVAEIRRMLVFRNTRLLFYTINRVIICIIFASLYIITILEEYALAVLHKTKTFILCKGHHLHYCKYNANSYTCLLFCMHNCKLFALLLSMKIMQIQNYTNIFKRSDNNYYISFFYSTRFSLTQGSSSRSSCIVHPDLEPQLRSSLNSLNVRGRG